jgi:general transcription factor 3C polypeptide 5 (transcription factor C subunit 1)
MREFRIDPGTDKGPNVDIIPPPIFTHMGLPFNYHYSQNPYVRTNEEGETINTTAVKQIGYFIGADDPAPTEPQEPADETDERFMEVMAELQSSFEERPIWTRRSLLNHLHGKLENWNELKKYLNYAAYQFKGGPWRDCVVPYGIDPRTDAKYRIYQTLMFKLTKHKQPQGKDALTAFGEPKQDGDYQLSSHIFDGETYNTDGKVWQVCDITDPLLRELLDNASVRQTWDVGSGWYHGGLWAKVKAIMKTKLVAIRFNRTLTRQDFAATLNFGDRTPPRSASSNLHLPLPNLRLSNDELTVLRGRKPPKKKSQGYNVKLYGRSKEVSQADDQTSMVSSPTRAPDDGAISNEEGDLDHESDDEGNESDLEDEFGGNDDGKGGFDDYRDGYGDNGSDVDAMHDNVQYSEYPELD